jgi:YVTN family beta-propeller protein
MVIVNDNVYFTNWNTNDVQVLNLVTYNIDASIPVGIMPEGIITDGNTLWVANSGETTVHEIDIMSRSTTAIFEVGEGPQKLNLHNGNIYISRTFYDEDWAAYHGASKIEGENILVSNYGSGAPCGGSVLSHHSDVYHSFYGGLARMDAELNLEEVSIGNFEQEQVYHVEMINDNFWFAITDWNDLNEVHVVDSNGNELMIYEVGQNPGDFAFWSIND